MSGQSATLDISGTAGIPFTRLVQVELRKMTDTRAGKWLMIIIAVITVLAVGLLSIFGEGDRTFAAFLGAAAAPQGFLLPVLGVLLVTSEWGQRSTLTTFTLVPHRGRIVLAKTAAAVLLGAAAIVVAMIVAAVAALLHAEPGAWDDYGPVELLQFGLLQTLGILQGLAFGLLFLNSAAAIVSYYVLPIAFSIVSGLVPGVRDVQPWIDLGTAQSPLFGESALGGEQWAQLGTTTLLWIGLPMAVGVARVLRAEVK